MRSIYNDLKQNISQRAPWIVAALGFFYYAYALWHASQFQISVLDEGLYLFKGWLFSSGAYQPFQHYGPWTNQMPFAFYIPGWLQQAFGPSLASGRWAAVVLGLLTYIGLGLTLRKFADWKITSLLLISFALNSAQTKMVAIATSQGLIAFLATWSLYFLLAKKQTDWQLFVSGTLAGLIVMVRINMLPILPLMVGYVLWERGWKSALWNTLGISVFFIGGHAILWPQILQIWAKWLPLPFLSAWFAPKTIPTWHPDNPLGFRVASFFLSFRYHFAALVGGFLSLGWVNFQTLKSDGKWKIFIFLYTAFATLFLTHFWAALLNDYCVFCFPTYITFFANIGLVLTAIGIMNFTPRGFARAILTLLTLTAILAGIAYSAEEIFFDRLGENVYKWVLNLKVPATNAAIWQLFANKFAIEQSALFKAANSFFPILITVLTIAIISILYFFIQKKTQARSKFGWAGLGIGLYIAVLVVTPSKLLGGGYNTYDCDKPVVDNYDRIGDELSSRIPSDSSLYWAGYSPVTLLRIPQAVIYPAQLHTGYSYRISDNDDALLQYGWWNEHLALKWASEADYILVEAKNYDVTAALANGFKDHELIFTSEPQNCRQYSEMLLFRRTQ